MQKYDELDSFEFGQPNPPEIFKGMNESIKTFGKAIKAFEMKMGISSTHRGNLEALEQLDFVNEYKKSN